MPTQDDFTRYRQNYLAEQNAITLYEKMSKSEPNPDLSKVYSRLAETERRHAEQWAERLRSNGQSVPVPAANWRTRTLAWLAGRFGAGFVLPTITTIERDAGKEYDNQPEALEVGMQNDERSHARVFNYISRTTPGMEGSAVARFEGRHRSTGGNALRAGVLGANDGLVSNLSLVMGVAGAAVSGSALLVTGLAGLLAGALSMALGEWLSVQSSRELYQHQITIEKQELSSQPEEEVEELALIYQAKGIAPDQARALAERLITDPASALDTLAREELSIDPNELGGSSWEAAITSFFLFAAGAIVPVIPFFFLSGFAGVALSLGLSTIGLFVIGAGITLVTGRSALTSGLRMVVFGMLAAGITFGIGRLVGASLGA
jgi:vacuolar iron transporter family protein